MLKGPKIIATIVQKNRRRNDFFSKRFNLRRQVAKTFFIKERKKKIKTK